MKHVLGCFKSLLSVFNDVFMGTTAWRQYLLNHICLFSSIVVGGVTTLAIVGLVWYLLYGRRMGTGSTKSGFMGGNPFVSIGPDLLSFPLKM